MSLPTYVVLTENSPPAVLSGHEVGSLTLISGEASVRDQERTYLLKAGERTNVHEVGDVHVAAVGSARVMVHPDPVEKPKPRKPRPSELKAKAEKETGDG